MALLRSAVLVSALAMAAVLGNPARLAAQESGAEPAGAAAPGGAAPVDAGAYLAGRSAEAHGDFRASAAWFARALLADGENLLILDGGLFANLTLGEIATAAELARKVKALGAESQLADMALLAEQAQAEDYAGLVAAFALRAMGGA